VIPLCTTRTYENRTVAPRATRPTLFIAKPGLEVWTAPVSVSEISARFAVAPSGIRRYSVTGAALRDLEHERSSCADHGWSRNG
jgi:hypothetical protein